MTRKDFQVIAKLISILSFHLKDGCFIIGNCEAEDGLLLEELHDAIDNELRKQNKNYSPEKFWNAVYKDRKQIIEAINNTK